MTIRPTSLTLVRWLLAIALASVLAAGLGLAAPTSAGALARLALCSNNLDDDGDGKFDFRSDPGCNNANDNNGEVDPVPVPVCSDGLDNDGDLKIDFPAEPGCGAARDVTEVDPAALPPCSNGLDDDADGAIDYPADAGCNWAADNEPDRACSDGLDNDSDAVADFPADLGCANVNDNNESDPPQCDDGRDNDADGTLDFGVAGGQTADTDCESATDAIEAPSPMPPPIPPRCADGLDNDGDGKIDFPFDPGCLLAADDDEADPPPGLPPALCADGLDNDADGPIDYPSDAGCASPDDGDETDPPPPVVPAPAPAPAPVVQAPVQPTVQPLAAPAGCADGRDNDADGRYDHPGDPGCSSAGDDDESEPRLVAVAASSDPALLTPVPIVRLRGRSGRDGVRITLLTVRAPATSQVTIYCSGRSCPRGRLAVSAGSPLIRLRTFERRVRGGTVLRIYVTKPGFIGKYTRFRFGRDGVPLRADRCARTPGGKPLACPGS